MTTPETTVTENFDPYQSASDPVVQTFDLWGRVEISAWACALVKGQGKVPFDPNNPNHKRFTAIDIFIQPLADIDVKYPRSYEEHWIAESREWANVTLNSIKVLGIDNVREINGKWARVARIPNGKKYEKKDAQGNPTGEMKDETTFKFFAFFNTEEECRAAYLAAGGQPNANGQNPTPAQVTTSEDTEKVTAYAFLKVIVQNAARGKKPEEAKAATALALTAYPPVAKYFTVDSPETVDLIVQFAELPF